MKYYLLLALSLFSTSFADPWDKLETWPCTYLEKSFTQHIRRSAVKTIVELGGYNGLDSILLHLHYKCPVYTFECDPLRTKEIKERFAPYPKLKLIEKGGWDETTEMTFYHANFSGASSFFEFNLPLHSKKNRVSIEELVEKHGFGMTPYTVQTTRLDEWMKEEGVETIDLICMDVQGAALRILKGMGDQLRNTRYVITEVDHEMCYKGIDLFDQIHDFMISQGFNCPGPKGNDVIFVNQNL